MPRHKQALLATSAQVKPSAIEEALVAVKHEQVCSKIRSMRVQLCTGRLPYVLSYILHVMTLAFGMHEVSSLSFDMYYVPFDMY